MARTWQLQEAKNKLSEVVNRAQNEGPQTITVRGKEVVVVISLADYRKARGTDQQEESLLDFFRRSPLWGSGIDIERQDDFGREIEL